MEWEKLFYLPEWDEKKMMQFVEEGDEWKNKASREAARVLYEQWKEVFYMATAVAKTLVAEVPHYADTTQKLMHENLMMVAPKLLSVANSTMYVLKMENAAIIRTNCREFMDQLKWALLTSMADKEHIEMLTTSMEVFKHRFKEWVATFEKDEIIDDWGLFI
jgi:hypothetical protein